MCVSSIVGLSNCCQSLSLSAVVVNNHLCSYPRRLSDALTLFVGGRYCHPCMILHLKILWKDKMIIILVWPFRVVRDGFYCTVVSNRVFRPEPHSIRSTNSLHIYWIKSSKRLNVKLVELIRKYYYFYFDACNGVFLSVEFYI